MYSLHYRTECKENVIRKKHDNNFVLVIADPPSEAGAVQSIITCESPEVATSERGTLGIVAKKK
jgi:hypothetical protein